MVFKFTIDKFLNRYVHPSIVSRFAQPFRRFLGLGNSTKVTEIDDYWIWLDILIGSFCGIALLEGVFISNNVFTNHHHAPMIIASYGATAILCFNAIQTPLAQPRNIFFGHLLSSLIGICFCKLFSLSEAGKSHYWASGALSVGVSSVAMTILNCVHPPAGASALLPSVDEGIREMSWWYLPVHIISSLLIITVSLIVDNVLRKYPVFWWTPQKLSETAKTELQMKVENPNVGSNINLDHLGEMPEGSGFKKVPELKYVIISEKGVYVPENYRMSRADIFNLKKIKNIEFNDIN